MVTESLTDLVSTSSPEAGTWQKLRSMDTRVKEWCVSRGAAPPSPLTACPFSILTPSEEPPLTLASGGHWWGSAWRQRELSGGLGRTMAGGGAEGGELPRLPALLLPAACAQEPSTWPGVWGAFFSLLPRSRLSHGPGPRTDQELCFIGYLLPEMQFMWGTQTWHLPRQEKMSGLRQMWEPRYFLKGESWVGERIWGSYENWVAETFNGHVKTPVMPPWHNA